MLFLSPLFLWFAAAAAVPVIIHLMNRRRHRTIPWAAMQFLLRATRQSRGKKKLRHILILTCRALGIAALAFAAARPVVSGLFGWGGNSIDLVVLVLDRSASMEGRPGEGMPSRRELVLQKVARTMKELGAARLVLIDSATGRPQEVASPDVLPELSFAAATDSEADFPALFARAAEYVADVQGRSEIWLASDLQESNWRPSDERWVSARAVFGSLPRKPAVRVISMEGGGASNVSVRLAGSERRGDRLSLDLELAKDAVGGAMAAVPLTLHLGGGKTTEMVAMPGDSLRLRKTVALPEGTEEGFGRVSVPDDGNPRDGVAFFAYGPQRDARAVVVAPQGEAARYLMLACAPPGLPGVQAEQTDPDSFAKRSLDEVALVVWAAPLPKGPAAASLEGFARLGGHVLFVAPSGAADAGGGDFRGISWGAPQESPVGSFFILKGWNRTDGPLRDGADGVAVPAARLKALQRRPVEGVLTWLANWEDGEGFLARMIVDQGSAWFLGSTPDYRWSNLGDADVLLPLVQRILREGAARLDEARSAEVGAPATRLAGGEVRRRMDDHGAENSSSAEYEAGVFRLGERLLAINRPAREDEAGALDRVSLDRVLEGTGYTLFEQAGKGDDPSMARDVWRAFLVAMLCFLIAEALLCLPKARAPEAAVAGTPGAAQGGAASPPPVAG